MKQNILIALLFVLGILTGCSEREAGAENGLEFSTAEAATYLDASREVIEGHGWLILSESGSTTVSGGMRRGDVTITGQAPAGQKVYFRLRTRSDTDEASLQVSTDDGFPLSVHEIVALVEAEH